MKINIAKDFSNTPGGRYIKDGPYSGELFLKGILKPKFKSLKKDEYLIIDFDGGYGYSISFLVESFGGLAREFGINNVIERIKLKSEEEPIIISDVIRYIKETKNNKKVYKNCHNNIFTVLKNIIYMKNKVN